MKSAWFNVAVAFAAGAAIAAQVGCNSTLRARMGHPLLAAFASFLIGTTILGVAVAAIRPGLPGRSALVSGPLWMWLGGLLGAIYIGTAAEFAPRLGAAGWLVTVVAAQILTSLLLDHFGWLGFSPHPISAPRVAGATLLLVGMALVLWK